MRDRNNCGSGGEGSAATVVVFSYARSQRKLSRLAREAGGNATAGTPREAAENADVTASMTY